MANQGEGSGIATIEGDTAILKPEVSEEECQITLKFAGGKLVVTQTGICGFGHNVSAESTYKKFRLKTQVRIGLVSALSAVATGLWPFQRGRAGSPLPAACYAQSARTRHGEQAA